MAAEGHNTTYGVSCGARTLTLAQRPRQAAAAPSGIARASSPRRSACLKMPPLVHPLSLTGVA